MFAGRSAGPLFHKKVTVEGADEDLSFNIAIPLPTPPPPPQQQQPPQGIDKHAVSCMHYDILLYSCSTHYY